MTADTLDFAEAIDESAPPIEREADTKAAPDGPPTPFVTPEQEQLLQILYLPPDLARPLFQEWYAAVDMQDLDSGCYRLYPHLYRRVKELDPENPFLGRLRGNYRKAVYHNHLLFHRGASYIARLAERGIASIVLKGAAFVRNVQGELGLRPMADIDILVHPRDAGTALALLSPNRQKYAEDRAVMEGWIEFRHAISMRSPSGLEMDLHWHLLPGWNFLDDPEAPFWAAAIDGRFNGVPTKFLDATDFLFHTLAHGYRWNPVPSIRWISDSLDLLAAEGDAIDWSRVVAHCQQHGLGRALAMSLRYLAERFHAPVPAGVPAELDALPEPALARLDFDLSMREWTSPVTWDETRMMSEHLLGVVRRRDGARPVVLQATDGLARAEVVDWCARNGTEYLFELTPKAAVFAAIRAQVLERLKAAGRGPGEFATPATMRARLDGPLDRRLAENLFVTLASVPEGLKLTAFATDIRRPSPERVALRPWNAYWLVSPVSQGLMKYAQAPMLPFAPDFFAVAGN